MYKVVDRLGLHVLFLKTFYCHDPSIYIAYDKVFLKNMTINNCCVLINFHKTINRAIKESRYV